jgi:hypothetical protein
LRILPWWKNIKWAVFELVVASYNKRNERGEEIKSTKLAQLCQFCTYDIIYTMKLKSRLTEEFLWKLYESLEALNKVGKSLGPRSFRDIANSEWRELRVFYEEKKRKRSFTRFVSYLKEQGYIRILAGKSVDVLQLTRKGNQKALEGSKKVAVLKPRKDGKLIMLMFDIPKNKEFIRKTFRSQLELLDYQMLQKSVWVSDKEVLMETERVVREFGLHSSVKIFIIENVGVQK